MTIQNAQTQSIEMTRDILLHYVPTYFNASYISPQPARRLVDIQLPTEFYPELLGNANYLRASQRNIEVRLLDSRVHVSLLTPEAMEDTQVFLYIYRDQYCYDLACVLSLTVRSYICLDVYEIAGKRFSLPITLESIFLLYS